jgi:hypothetical protein
MKSSHGFIFDIVPAFAHGTGGKQQKRIPIANHQAEVLNTQQHSVAVCSQTEASALKLNKHPVRTVQLTHSISVIKTIQLMLYKEIIAVCSEILTKYINKSVGRT